jgi:hypothetical protein
MPQLSEVMSVTAVRQVDQMFDPLCSLRARIRQELQ